MVTREEFETDAQFRKFNEIAEYVQKVIDLQDQGKRIFHNGELMEGFLFIDGTSIGHQVERCNFSIIGCTHGFNKKTQEYDLVWVPYTSLNNFKKKHKFEMYEKVVRI